MSCEKVGTNDDDGRGIGLMHCHFGMGFVVEFRYFIKLSKDKKALPFAFNF